MADRPLDRFLVKQPPPSEPKLGFEISEDGMVPMLDAVLDSGERVGLPYSYLTSMKLEAGGKLILNFPTLAIEICGRNLASLYSSLLVHLVRQIEPAAGGIDAGGNTSWIKSVVLVGE